jgi:hypothetical protein
VTPRSYFGMGLAVLVLVLAGLYIHKGGALTAAAGLTFGGGLLFCGLLIDFAEFVAVLNALRGKTPPVADYPPLPGSNDPAHPNTEAPK